MAYLDIGAIQRNGLDIGAIQSPEYEAPGSADTYIQYEGGSNNILNIVVGGILVERYDETIDPYIKYDAGNIDLSIYSNDIKIISYEEGIEESGGSYIIYNSGTSNLEFYVNGILARGFNG